MKKAVFLIFLLVLGILGLQFAFSKKSHCFHPSFCEGKSELSLPAAQPPRAPLDQILNQDFTFLSSGNQAFAFVSKDGKYVLKLIKFHTTSGKKLERVLNGFSLADRIHPEHQGWVYLHLPNSTDKLERIRLTDRAGMKHLIDPNPLLFAIQKKAVPTKSYLSRLSKTEREEKLKLLLKMIEEDLASGLWDQDHNILHNTGFIDGAPMRIDVGKLTYSEEMKDPQKIAIEIKKIETERVSPFVKKFSNPP